MKDVGSGMAVKTYLIWFWKKYMAYLKQKTLQKSGLTNTKWQRQKSMKSLLI